MRLRVQFLRDPFKSFDATRTPGRGLEAVVRQPYRGIRRAFRVRRDENDRGSSESVINLASPHKMPLMRNAGQAF